MADPATIGLLALGGINLARSIFSDRDAENQYAMLRQMSMQPPVAATPTTTPKPAANADIISAAGQVMEAQRINAMRALAQARKALDIQYGQTGAYNSGARITRQEELTEAALRDLYSAQAGTALQAQGLALQGSQLEQQESQFARTLALQEAAMEAQAGASEAALWSDIGQTAGIAFLEYGLPLLLNLFTRGGTNTSTGGSAALTQTTGQLTGRMQTNPWGW